MILLKTNDNFFIPGVRIVDPSVDPEQIGVSHTLKMKPLSR